MKYNIQVRGRPEDLLNQKRRHERIMKCLETSQAENWGFYSTRLQDFDPEDTLPIAQLTLTRAFRTQVKGTVHYYNRKILVDAARCDDLLDLEFDPTRQNYAYLLSELFPKLIASFDAYLGFVVHVDEWIDREGFVELRTTVPQLDLADYFDRTLCKRAFGLTPHQVAKRLRGHAAFVEATKEGVLIIATHEIIDAARASEVGRSFIKHLPATR